ncbi:hypothetical protein CVT24_008628 [Panaeolus cyanescens]|uniref:Uncharacterized protein n=1 Tax=Panaeolus cyanescens TaxID=181874 RepID=A0A409VB89_9AGAR|nr:hypothetical protein CVT24_008628 [Panaeolus cyanescens]
MANRFNAVNHRGRRHGYNTRHANSISPSYGISIGLLVPSLASASTCTTPEFAIVVSPWGPVTTQTAHNLASIYLASFSCRGEFVMQHAMTTLSHNSFSLTCTRVMVSLYPIAIITEHLTPRHILHKFLMKRFNGCSLFHNSRLWSNSSWVFTVFAALAEPYAFCEFRTVYYTLPSPINVLTGNNVSGFRITTLQALEQRILIGWRRLHRLEATTLGPVSIRLLEAFLPFRIKSSWVRQPKKPKPEPELEFVYEHDPKPKPKSEKRERAASLRRSVFCRPGAPLGVWLEVKKAVTSSRYA